MKSKLLLRIILFLLVLGAGMTTVVMMHSGRKPLKVYYPRDLNPKLVDSTLKGKKSYPLIAYQLINQNGDSVNESTYAGKIKVVDFFFTTCRSICPKMSAQLQRVQKVIKDPKVQLISHTVTPEIDSVAVLKNYADLYSSNSDTWHFLTGDKEIIYNLARKRYFAVVDEPSPEGPDFIHTENIILVDEQDQIRGFYDGTSHQETDRLIEDIEWLLSPKKP
ncbi:MAG: protein SCO1/2 [Sphingobacteriales bacterium]|jgi:protein SCO1/2